MTARLYVKNSAFFFAGRLVGGCPGRRRGTMAFEAGRSPPLRLAVYAGSGRRQLDLSVSFWDTARAKRQRTAAVQGASRCAGPWVGMLALGAERPPPLCPAVYAGNGRRRL